MFSVVVTEVLGFSLYSSEHHVYSFEAMIKFIADNAEKPNIRFEIYKLKEEELNDIVSEDFLDDGVIH